MDERVQKYEQKIGTLPKEDGKNKNKIEISFDFVFVL